MTSPVHAQAGIEYIYDSVGRLVGVVNAAGDTARYVYDAVGNLVSIERVNVADRPPGAVAITAVFPEAGPVGTVVTIVGRGFSTTPAANEVRFNGIPATVTAASPTGTRLTTTVPAGATTGPIRVTVASVTADSPRTFRVVGVVSLFPPGASVAEGSTVQFTASETGNPTGAFTWRVNGVAGGNPVLGTISATGLYTAPSRRPAPAVVAITAAPVDAPSTFASAALGILGSPDSLLAVGAAVSVGIASAPVLDTLAVGPAVSVGIASAPVLDTLLATDALSVKVASPASSLETFETTEALLSVSIGPVITAVTPAQGMQGQTALVTLTGVGFSGATPAGLAFLYNNAGDAAMSATSLTVNGAGTEALAQVTIGSAAAVGSRVVRITTPGGTSTALGTGGNLFAVQAAAPAPDLTVTAVNNPPASVVQGGTFSVTDTVTNQGPASAAASTVRYYLSANTAKDGSDALLTGTRSVGALAAAATSSGTVTVTVPGATPAGTYYLLACADDLGVVMETSEVNNCRASTATTQVVAPPDLTVTVLNNPPGSVVQGGTFSVTDTVTNQGAGSAAASTVRYYLSVNTVRDAGDTLLTGTRSVGVLAAQAASSGSRTVTVPSATALGTYYLLACADDLSVVAESSETNNCRASTTTVQVLPPPDLTVTAVNNPPASVVQGGTFSVTDTVMNQGPGAAGASTVRYYLSANTAKDGADTRLTGTRSVGALAAQAASSGTVTVTVPGTMAVGTYYLLVCADDLAVLTETSEVNNCRASATTVQVTVPVRDLTVTAVSNPPATVGQGGTFSVTDTVLNEGTGSAAASTVRYYLSVDTAKDGGDTLLAGTRSVGAVAAQGTSSGSVVVTVPSAMALGTYYVLACADDLNVVMETSEVNNCGASATTVQVTTPAGPVARWTFDEGSGTVAGDSTGNGNTGTLFNSPTWTTGKIAGAIQLNGTTQDVRVPDSPSLSIAGTGLTLAMWIHPTVAQTGTLLYKDHQFTLRRNADGSIGYADSVTWSYSTIGSHGQTSLDAWSHVAVTFDGISLRFYVNGVQVSTLARGGSLTDNANQVYIGSYGGTTRFAGKLDEIHVYGRALSAEEVANLYAAGN